MPDNNACWLKDECNRCDCGGFCMRYYKLSRLYDMALVPLARRKHVDLKVDADGTDKAEFLRLKEIEAGIREFVANGESLYIHSSSCGNGKTSWALRLIEDYLGAVWPSSGLECRALFISVPRLLLALKDGISNKNEYADAVKASVATCDLAVFDDIGTKAATQFEHEHLLSMIDTRIGDGKANIFTSNLTEDALRESLGDRLYSRIVNASVGIELKGRDKRHLGVEG